MGTYWQKPHGIITSPLMRLSHSDPDTMRPHKDNCCFDSHLAPVRNWGSEIWRTFSMMFILKTKSQMTNPYVHLHLPIGEWALAGQPGGSWFPILPLTSHAILVKPCKPQASVPSTLNWRGWTAWSLRMFSKVAGKKTITSTGTHIVQTRCAVSQI